MQTVTRIISVGCTMVVSALTLAGCGADTNSTPSSLLVTNPTARTADIYLVAGYNRNNLWDNFNGYANGNLSVSVPLGYKVALHITNDGGVPYDVGVYTTDQRLAFPGAGTSLQGYVQNPSAGIMPGSSATYSFVANQVGDYRLADLLYQFPAHQEARLPIGMWGEFHVTAAGSPHVTTTTE
ncbi:sulfocyanin-like copper-binding protein [Alicyclobacillus sp. ALC3]|uniref:sulfocyanin-like copper-binding protein n=1 Tax=Alicyclobacillus sp. ALC3 TaxID=2796143 RepID=UPI002379DD4B|nr:sulfocyanin-like copper-binding protein [Alicyclobacillus sp. ALC3]WDL96119.1 hypothetical protein JC200_17515 [Alicyclobacillus sp. ALC3]